MTAITKLLENNRKWAERIRRLDPEFFSKLTAQQAPRYLWIGCSDSRVPANEIVNLLPGEMFVHRNVANLVIHTDMNCLSVIQYAVDVLKIQHVIVCGHYACGGIKAAMAKETNGLVDNWLRHIRDIRVKHQPKLNPLSNEDQERLMCELNVVEQVINAGNTTVIRDSWKRGQEISIYGWIYDVSDGLLKDLGVRIRSFEDLEQLRNQ